MANRFERSWDEAVEECSERLRDAGATAAEVVAATDALEHLGFPGQAALLAATEDGDGEVGDALLEALAEGVATRDEIEALGVDAADVSSLLRGVLRRPTGDATVDPATRRRVVAAALERLAAREGIAATTRDCERAADLLLTGEFFGDLAATTAAIAHAVPRVPLAIARDVAHLPLRLPRLLIAATRDLLDVPRSIRAVVEDLLDGSLDRSPRPLEHTMRALYSFATLKTILATVNELLGPENATARLAVIATARANGVRLDEADLDAFLAAVTAEDEPDLAPFVERGTSALRERHGERWTEVVARLGR